MALTEQQIERANEELAAMADGWILSAEGWRDIAQHLQYALAPVDADVIDIMCGTFQIAEGNGVKRMAAAAQVLQSRHDAELAEYKKALGPVTDEEWPYQEHAPVDLPRLAAPYITRQYADAIFEHRRALLEKKPEPTEEEIKEQDLPLMWRGMFRFVKQMESAGIHSLDELQQRFLAIQKSSSKA